jgi:hypothetical protein
MKKGITSKVAYDKAGIWTLQIKKQKGKLTLDEIEEVCRECEHGFYMLVIKAMDEETEQFFDVDDLKGDFVTLYKADDFFRWREKE